MKQKQTLWELATELLNHECTPENRHKELLSLIEDEKNKSYKEGYGDGVGDKKLIKTVNNGLGSLLSKTTDLVNELKINKKGINK